MLSPVTIRPRFGRVLAVIVIAIVAAAAVSLIVSGDPAGVRTAAFPVFLAYGAWLTLWHPRVHIDAERVEVRNVFRTIEIPWARIRSVDTQYSLRLHTDRGAFSAWAAPAPGRHRASSLQNSEVKNLPASSYEGGTVRPGDAPETDSGSAATIIRLHLASGAVDTGRDVRVRTRWAEVAVFAVLVAIVVLAAIG